MADPVCGGCGTRLRPTARFCDACGAAVTVRRDAPEYKQVTVLFADVVSSMVIARTLDVERYRELITDLVKRAAAAVQRYGGMVEHTGDGVMAVFGAPVAMEDHAVRGCLAALAIQEEASRLAAEVAHRDGVPLRVRVGLNSGQVIAGEFGPGPFGYRATGVHVGWAQRMESVAPPGGVMLSESTAHLVEHLATLGPPQSVTVKGADGPVLVRRLLALGHRQHPQARAEARLVGRQSEMAILAEHLDLAVAGRGSVTHLRGGAGVGKSRMAREIAKLAARQGVQVTWTYCESHTRDIPFHAVADLLREVTGVADLGDDDARARIRDRLPWADPQDLALLDDLLGVADPAAPAAVIDPDAWRRRLHALLTAAARSRPDPALMVIEDAHWIDDVSDSLLADLLVVVPQTPLLVVITSRPEYGGALTRLPGLQTLTLAPLPDSDITAVVTELLGTDTTVSELTATITERAAGNSFFAEEMIRELAQRGVLVGAPGHYTCRADVTDVTVPATVQAAVEARIDRLSSAAKRAVTAASVIGARFDADLLAALGVDAVPDELTTAGLIDQVRSAPRPEYAFRHPLIRAVAYESQLRSERMRSHRLVADAIRDRDPAAADENAALIAEHLEAAGEPGSAFTWHMRAGARSADRDVRAAHLSWERARRVADALADALADDDPECTRMRIAPRALLCGIGWRVQSRATAERFDELRTLCATVEDRASLAAGMAGLLLDHALQGRLREAAELASETWALVGDLDDPALTVGLSFSLIYAAAHCGQWRRVRAWSQRVIDVAGGDPSIGTSMLGCPLALAFITRGMSGYCLGESGWQDDLRHGLEMARGADPLSYATALAYVYFPGIAFGVVAATHTAVREIEDALEIAERSGDDMGVHFARATLGLALVHLDDAAERARGRALLAEVGAAFRNRGHNLSELPFVLAYTAWEQARSGRPESTVPSVAELPTHDGHVLGWGYAVPTVGVLAQMLLARGTEDALREAESLIDRLATSPADDGFVLRDIWLLRLRALSARARGDDATHRALADRYRTMAKGLGFQGHICWAERL